MAQLQVLRERDRDSLLRRAPSRAAKEEASTCQTGKEEASGGGSEVSAGRQPPPPSLDAMIARARAGGYARMSHAVDDLEALGAVAAAAWRADEGGSPAAPPRGAEGGGEEGDAEGDGEEVAAGLDSLLRVGVAQLRRAQLAHGDRLERPARERCCVVQQRGLAEEGGGGEEEGEGGEARELEIEEGPFGGERCRAVALVQGRPHLDYVELANRQVAPTTRPRHAHDAPTTRTRRALWSAPRWCPCRARASRRRRRPTRTLAPVRASSSRRRLN